MPMPVPPDLIDRIAGTVVQLYADVEQALVETIAARLRSEVDEAPYEIGKLDAIGPLRRSAQAIYDTLQASKAGIIRDAVARAYRSGTASAQTGLPDLTHSGHPRLPATTLGADARAAMRDVPNAHVIENLAAALHRDTGKVEHNILRAPLDAYRAVQAATAARVATGIQTRREASQAAWQALVDKGIVSFTDVRGRRWKLSSYVEMIARTNIQRAAVQGQTDRLKSLDVDLVIVSDSPRECPLCRPWERKILSLSGHVGKIRVEHATRDGEYVTVDVKATLDQARSAGLMHPNCFPGGVLVSAPSGVVAADARWYQGPLVVVHTASGHELPVTPNHPILTPEGWVPAGSLKVGQSILRYRLGTENVPAGGPGNEQVPARIRDVFDALRQASPMPPIRVPVAPEQFHGDGFGSDVDVVLADGLLRHGAGQQSRHGQLVGSGVGARALLSDGSALKIFSGSGHAANGVMGGSGEGVSLLGGHPLRAPHSRLRSADRDTALADPTADTGLTDAEPGRELVLALSGLVEPDEVIDLGRRQHSGHVYNLQSGDGWYVANEIVVHNCTHSVSAYTPGITQAGRADHDPEGYVAKQKQRKLERDIRAAKLREAGALTDDAKREAGRDVRAAQAALRTHLDANPKLKRLRYREQIGAGNTPPKGGPKGGPSTSLTPPPEPPPAAPAAGAGAEQRIAEQAADQAAKKAARKVPAKARPFHRNLDGIEQLVDAVEHQAVRDTRRLGGASAQTELLDLADGSKVIRKRARAGLEEMQDADAEQATSLIARKLGLNAPGVYRNNSTDLYMDYIGDGVTPEEAGAWTKLPARFAKVPDSDQGKRMGLLDVLTGNVDRNQGNWLLTGDDTLIPIDHGMAWDAVRAGSDADPGLLRNNPFAKHYLGDTNPLTRADVDELRQRLEDLRPDFQHIGKTDWLDYSLRVLDRLATGANGRRDLIAGTPEVA